MIKEILTAAGVKHRRARQPKPLAGTYAAYMDDVEAGGADGVNCLRTHDYTVELYTPDQDEADKAEAAIEAELDGRGIPWTRQDRYWLQDEQRYQTVYEFTHTEKRRIPNG